MVSFEMNDRKKIGLGLTGFGIFFSILGIIFFLDKGLLAMGNMLFVSGVSLTIGPKSTMQFFMKRQNFKGTISFGVGFFFVVIGWPVVGMILESYGFIVLFSGFWPTLAVFLQKIPILGWIFQQPIIRLEDKQGKFVPVFCGGVQPCLGNDVYAAIRSRLFRFEEANFKYLILDRYRGRRVPV